MATILIDKLLQTVVNRKASDLHIAVGQPPVVRIDGHMKRLETKSLEPEDTAALMKAIAPERCQQELQEVGGADFGFAFGDQCRFRVSIFKQKGYVGMVLRQIPNKLLDFKALGTPPVLAKLCERPRGLILVTGPTGSGKTTTLAAMVDYINDSFEHHIITIEDPIEFYHTHKKSTVNQRELGVDVPTFAEAIRRALRQDPDVILVGEMRDLETIRLAMTAAETGHLVFGTLHTSSAAKTIDRIVDVFPPEEKETARTQLSESLQAVVSQALLKTKDGSSRVAAHEIMVCNSAIRNLIREAKVAHITGLLPTQKQIGNQTLDQSLLELVKRGAVSMAEARAKATSKEQFAG